MPNKRAKEKTKGHFHEENVLLIGCINLSYLAS